MYTPKSALACVAAGSALLGPIKASLRQLHEGARTMRETMPVRRQPVFFFARHFAECMGKAVGQKDRIVPEALIAARGEYQDAVDARLEFLDVAVRPGDAKRRHEMRRAPLGRYGAQLLQQQFDALHGAAKIFVRPGPS